MQILKILKYVENNTDSAFFYTPNIYPEAKSYWFKKPEIKFSAKTKEEVEELLEKVDKLSQRSDLIAFAAIPYEIGYYFQPKRIKNEKSETNEFRVSFYDKRNAEVLESNEINFSGVENEIAKIKATDSIELDISKEEYIDSIRKIKNYIKAGDTYQINYTTKAKFRNVNKLSSLFLNGIFNQSAAYSAIINFKDQFILSFSPELFFKTDYRTIMAKPMKGTIKRKGNPEEDKKISEFLKNDEKNRAENVMIVDLMRNDIGKISEMDSVKVTKLYDVEKYETLYQLTSTVEGKLKEKKISTILKNLFPSGSITGAPKIRSMRIISELEKSNRNIYTGSIGIFDNKQATFNIPIRTLSINKKDNISELGLGSGVVWDSDAVKEYDEVLLKGKFITAKPNYFNLLETMLWEYGEYFLLDYHIKRLSDSANFLQFKFEEEKIINKLKKISSEFESSKKYKVRLLLSKWGEVKIDKSELNDTKTGLNILIRQVNDKRNSYFYFHKTTMRPWDKELKKAKSEGFDEILYINNENELLEGAFTNVLIKIGSKIYTPPLHLGILNGCYRQFLVEKKHATEKTLTMNDLKCADEIIMCNSVRKEMEVVNFCIDT